MGCFSCLPCFRQRDRAYTNDFLTKVAKHKVTVLTGIVCVVGLVALGILLWLPSLTAATALGALAIGWKIAISVGTSATAAGLFAGVYRWEKRRSDDDDNICSRIIVSSCYGSEEDSDYEDAETA